MTCWTTAINCSENGKFSLILLRYINMSSSLYEYDARNYFRDKFRLENIIRGTSLSNFFFYSFSPSSNLFLNVHVSLKGLRAGSFASHSIY